MRDRFLQLVVCALILLLNVTPSNCQIYTPSKIKKYLTLSDKVHILTLFVDTEEDEWSDEEVETYYAELLKSQRWLQEESEKWNQYLVFDNEYFFLENKSVIHLENNYLRYNSRVIIQKLIQELDYLSFSEFLAENDFDLENKKLKVVIFIKSANRSHAYNRWSKKDMDLAVIYYQDKSGKATDQYVISHEILHQFGAWDLYYERGKVQTYESGMKAKETYPHSIMRNTNTNKEQLEIDEVTAYKIGWNKWQESFNEYDPFLNQEQIKEEAIKKKHTGKVYKYTLGKKDKTENN